MTLLPFAEYCAQVQEHIERNHGIRVVTRDIPDPLTGDLDGAEIHIDYAVTPEQRLFLLAHLFGHTVQWNTDARALQIGLPRTPPVDEELMPVLLAYEQEAARYGLGALHAVGILDADQWFCDYSAADLAYLTHWYRTGEKLDFASFQREGSALLTPLAAPRFTPAARVFRRDGIVI